MIRQARTGDTVLDKSREMTGRNQTLPWWLGKEGVKTTENQILYIVPVGVYLPIVPYIASLSDVFHTVYLTI